MLNQPTYAEKLATLLGEKTGWDFLMEVPPVSTYYWTNDDWIRFIGDRWFRKT